MNSKSEARRYAYISEVNPQQDSLYHWVHLTFKKRVIATIAEGSRRRCRCGTGSGQEQSLLDPPGPGAQIFTCCTGTALLFIAAGIQPHAPKHMKCTHWPSRSSYIYNIYHSHYKLVFQPCLHTSIFLKLQ